MARIRSVKPEYWDDRKLAKRTSRDARLLYIALWNLADEHGRLNGDPQWIKGQVFSYDDDLDASAIAKMLEELEAPAVGAVMAYEVDGDPYLFLPKLAKHQRLEPEKVKSRLPDPPGPGAPEPPPDTPQSESGADESERRADESARDPDESEPDAKGSAPHADKPALLYVAGSMEHGAGGRGSRTGVRERPPPTILANTLLDEHIAQCRGRPPRDVIGALGEKIDGLLDEKQDPDVIRQALARLRQKTNLGPGALPVLVNEIIQGPPADDGRQRRHSRGGAADPLTDQAYGPGSTRI